MTTALLITSISTASAYTVYRDSANRRFVYNKNITTNTTFNNAFRFNSRIIIRNSDGTPVNLNSILNNNQAQEPIQETPEQPVQEAPQEQEITPQQPVQEIPQEVTPVETPEVNVPSQEPTTPQAPQEVENVNLAPGNTSNARHALTQAEIQMVEYVNEARAQAGLQPLAIDVDLSYVARIKSQDMQNNNYFSHTSPTYGSPFDMMRNFGIQYRAAAENIAINSNVRAAHNALMNSEGHRRNILNPNFTHIGIGIQNRHYTQMFIQK
ncbi:MAG: serine protease [Clostridiaceae bacterium]|nr:serine protease [Clostridiaceae bacterium]